MSTKSALDTLAKSTTPHESDHRRTRIISALSASAVALFILSGCMTSPYSNQVFEDRTKEIPLQAFLPVKNAVVKYECAKAYHGGVYPDQNSVDWQLIDTVTASQQSIKDSTGSKVYGAGIKRVLPASCWRFDSVYSSWMSSVRASTGTGPNLRYFSTFDRDGLECLGRENGKSATYRGYENKGCVRTYSNTGNPIPYVIIREKSAE